MLLRDGYCGSVKFHLLDRVVSISDDEIIATKSVSLAEEYLADHFPTFPVLPGVMMLEAATQAASWLVFRASGLMNAESYDGPTLAVLKSARNLRYGHFVAPGHTLTMKASRVGDAFKIEGSVDAADGLKTAITGKLTLASLRVPDHADANQQLVEAHRRRWQVLTAASPELAATALAS